MSGGVEDGNVGWLEWATRLTVKTADTETLRSTLQSRRWKPVDGGEGI